MNWSRLLPVRRRHLRRSAGDRGPAGVLPRVDLPGSVDLRLGPAAEEAAPGHDLAGRRSGTMLSAYFILAANSFMQHPVGYEYNPVTGRAEITDFVAILSQNTAVSAFAHMITTSLPGRRRPRRRHLPVPDAQGQGCGRGACHPPDRPGHDPRGLVFVVVTGDIQAKIMVEQQPMKMAAAEALYETAAPAPSPSFTVGTLDGSERGLLRSRSRGAVFLATGHLGRRGPGHQQPAGGIRPDRRGVRHRRLRPEHPDHLLDLPADDRDGRAGLRSSRSGPSGPTRKGRVPTTKWFAPDRDPAAAAASVRRQPSAGSSPRWAASRGSSTA